MTDPNSHPQRPYSQQPQQPPRSQPPRPRPPRPQSPSQSQQPIPQRANPQRSRFPDRPQTKQAERTEEWRSFSALPAPDPQPDPQPAAQPEASDEPKLASWKKRIGSFALDFGLGLGASYVAQGVAAAMGVGAETVSVVGYGAFFATWLVNRGYFQSRPAGQSLGKWLLNIKTVDTETDQAPTLIRSVAREGVTSLFILTESLVVPLGADTLFAIFDKEKRQTIHDRAGRTKVVEADSGFELDQKAGEWLEEAMQGEAAEDLKAAAENLLAIAKQNETVSDLSDQFKRLSKDLDQSTKGIRQDGGKQAQKWVDTIKKKLDN